MLPNAPNVQQDFDLQPHTSAVICSLLHKISRLCGYVMAHAEQCMGDPFSVPGICAAPESQVLNTLLPWRLDTSLWLLHVQRPLLLTGLQGDACLLWLRPVLFYCCFEDSIKNPGLYPRGAPIALNSFPLHQTTKLINSNLTLLQGAQRHFGFDTLNRLVVNRSLLIQQQ
mgnify:CR=1 FL=1